MVLCYQCPVTARVLILVLSVDREPWRSIEREGQRATWAAESDLDGDAPVRFYRGRSTGLERVAVGATLRALRLLGAEQSGTAAHRLRTRLLRRFGRRWSQRSSVTIGDVVHTTVPETYWTVTPKLSAALTHILASEQFDFLLRTNTSTYIDRRRLLDLAANLPRTGYWGGFVGDSDGIPFTSGTGTLLSHDVVVDAVRGHWDWALLDDVALGRVLHGLGHAPRPLPRPEYSSVNQVADVDPHAFMWRCKGEPHRSDVGIMVAVDHALHPG